MNEELKKNIGKKCRILETWRGLKKGDICEIKDCDRNSYYIYTKDKSSKNVMYPNEIEIIEDTPDEDKTGKKYRCIENNVHFTTSDIITLIKDDGSCCCLYQSNNGTKAYFMNDKLVPMSEDTPETKPETKPDTKHKFKEGDRVKVIGRNPKNIYGGIEGKTAIVKSLNGWVNGIEKYILTFDSESFNRYWDLTEDLELVSSEGDRNHLSNGDSHSTVTTVKKNKLMEKLRKIPSTLKRILDKDLQSMYKVGFINGDLALTAEGEKEVLNYLITVTATKKAISDIAKAIIVESKEDK